MFKKGWEKCLRKYFKPLQKYKRLIIVFALSSCESNFAWHVISPFTKQGSSNIQFLVEGYVDTLLLTCLSILISVALGLVLALIRISKNKAIRLPAQIYIAFFRSIPLMVLVLWVFYGLPIFLDINLGVFASGVIALVLSDVAFEAEIFRGAIQSIPDGQKEAAQTLGMKTFSIYRLIIIPQALKKSLPTLCNQFIYMLKMSAIVSIIGLTELTKKANELVVTTYRPLEIYTLLILEYFVLIIFFSWLISRLEKRLKRDIRQ